MAITPQRARPYEVTTAGYVSYLVATLFAASATVSLATFSRAWHAYQDAYVDLPHDAVSIAGTQLSVVVGVTLDVVLVVLTGALGAHVLRGSRHVAPIARAVGGFALLRLCCCNTVIAALARDKFSADQFPAVDHVSFDLTHAVPAWAQHSTLALQTAIVVALTAMLILMTRPASKAYLHAAATIGGPPG